MLYCFNTRVETEAIGVQTSRITAWLQLVIFDVPCLICCNSTTNPAMDAKSIALERSEKILRLYFDMHFSSYTLSGVSVNTVHYAGSNNPHI
jgi:hypothetical protein